jgi:hypothetical protein
MHAVPKLSLRLVLAVAFVIAAVWAATALAGGSQSPSGDRGSGTGSDTAYMQDGGGGQRGDCPERDGSGGSRSGDGSPDV